MGKRRHENDLLQEVDAPTMNGEKQRKKRKKDKHDVSDDGSELRRSSSRKGKKEKRSGKKEKEETKVKKEKKERSSKKRKKSEAQEGPLLHLDGHQQLFNTDEVNAVTETPSLPSQKRTNAEKNEKSSRKKDKKEKKESSKKRRRKSDSTHSAPSEENEEAKMISDVIDLTLPDKKDANADDKEADRGHAKRKSKKASRSGATESAKMDTECTMGLHDLPTLDDIHKKATTKRNAFLHGHAAVPLFSPKLLQALDEQNQAAMIGASANLCERIMQLIHDVITTANKWTKAEAKDDGETMEESVISDMVRLKKVPLAKQYVEMTLWRRVVRLNKDHLMAASRIGFGKGFAEGDTKVQGGQGLLLHREKDPDAEFVSYRDAHMKDIVQKYSESLEKMRESESMDADRVQFLLRCLDAGASLFGNLKCLEKRSNSSMSAKGY